MNHATFIVIYWTISIAVLFMEFILMFNSFKKRNPKGLTLGFVCLFGAIVNISYSISLFLDTATQYFYVSLASTGYFLGIDFMLVFMCHYVYYFTKQKWNKRMRIYTALLYGCLLVDVISLTVNPFHEWAVHFEVRNTFIANYRYIMYPLYYFHLIYTYSMVVMIVLELIRKVFMVPSDYRRQYVYGIIGIFGIVLLNATFLFMPILEPFNFIDYSIWGYGITMLVLYWITFTYSKHGMLDHFRYKIFENINQGIILFDFEDNMILENEKIHKMLKNIEIKEDMDLEVFLEQCEIKRESKEEPFSIQCYISDVYGLKPIRCDYRPLKNKKKEVMGQLFVFTDYQMDTDLLTGFQTLDSFEKFSVDHDTSYSVVVFDINDLSSINAGLGRSEGDQVILKLARSMKEGFPSDTFFIRGKEANLIALCLYNDKKIIEESIEKVKDTCTSSFQYGIAYGNKNVKESIEEATLSMQEKKLLDVKSRHSNMLNSLIKALQESDDDTEAHVKRTQKMGKELGKRIGLSDSQQSDLSLLCILHDIGKIGVPLEILNKPGKLSDSEWKVLASHVTKGYQIAMSNPELSGIAEMILHHHERWDGKGYPDGLTREAIPLLSRIIAVVDAYDAMVNNRSYRKAISKAQAREELRRCAGSQFDPGIVVEFLLMLEENVDDRLENDDEDFVQTHSLDINQETDSFNVHTVAYTKYKIDNQNYIVEIDDVFTELLGYTKEDVQNMHLNQMDLIPSEDQIDYMLLTNQQLAQNQMAYFEHRVKRKDGSILYVFCFGRQYYDSSLRQEMSEIIVFDSSNTYAMRQISQQEQERAKTRLARWEDKYRRDSLTGLYTHEAFKNEIELNLLTGQFKTMLIMMDVDRFKEYNDTYGHHAGDEFLVFVAQTIESTLRKNDMACRMGGDEFASALFFPKDVSDERMKQRAHEIFTQINLKVTSTMHGTSLSMGFTISDEDTKSFNQLYEKADKALYASKENGRNRIS